MSGAEIFVETGSRIRDLRGAISQAEFAERIGVDRKTVVRWEAGERLPDGKSLLALMQVFGASASHLLMGSEGGAQLADAAEQVLIDAYRRCNSEARRNLIQTAALLAAGVMALDEAHQARPGVRPPLKTPGAKTGFTATPKVPSKMVNKAAGSVQVGHQSGGQVTVKNKGSKR